MRKTLILMSIFAVLIAGALVYAVHSPQPVAGNNGNNVLNNNFNNNIDVPKDDIIFATHKNDNVTFSWKLGNPYVLRHGDGEVLLDLYVSGKRIQDKERKPVNTVIVIDRSGSMADENKLGKVKEAAIQLIDQLGDSDKLGVVIYDSSYSTLIPSSTIENRGRVKELIYSLYPGGGTNLYGGLIQGFEEARKHFNRNHLNRIVLLSDGLANEGVTDPREISRGAKNIREHGISVTTMGVGVEFNEVLMAGIADDSGGNYYYIRPETNMAEFFNKEWNLMQKVIATGANASIALGKGVQVIDVPGYSWEQTGRSLKINLPDVYSGSSRKILVNLKVPAGDLNSISIGKGTFGYMDVTGSQPKAVQVSFAPSVKIIEDRSLFAKNVDQDVKGRSVTIEASKKMQKALDLFEYGKREDAEKMVAETQEELQSLGYTDSAVMQESQAIGSYISQPQAAPDSKEGKDFLKDKRDEQRKQQQSTSEQE